MTYSSLTPRIRAAGAKWEIIATDHRALSDPGMLAPHSNSSWVFPTGYRVKWEDPRLWSPAAFLSQNFLLCSPLVLSKWTLLSGNGGASLSPSLTASPSMSNL